MKVRLIQPCDTLIREDDGLLLYPDELIRLSGLGTAIAEFTVNPITVSNLAAELVERFGSPDGATAMDATQSVVDQLIERGVLEVL